MLFMKQFMLTVMKRTILWATVVLFLTCLLLVSFVPFSKADFEEPERQWDETYGPLEGYSVAQTFDGGYIVAGQQADFREFQPHLLSGWENKTAVIVKVDSSGNLKWKKTYNVAAEGGSHADFVVQTADSGYTIIGLQQKPDKKQIVFVIKTDSNGDIQWNTTIVWPESTKLCEGIQTTDGCYILAGVTRGDGPDSSSWILKVDERGNSLWNRTFGDSTNKVFAVTEANDGGYLIAGNWKNDCWFVKMDVNGNLQWNQTYDLQFGDSSGHYVVNSIVQAVDGGYIFAGDNDYRAFIVKTDSQGIMDWNRSYTDETVFRSIVQSNDGEGYFAVGDFSVPDNQSPGALFARLDSSGNLLWNSTYRNSKSTWASNTAHSIIRTSDNGYAVAGTLEDNIWLVKFAPDYVAPPDDNTLPDSSDDLPEDVSVFTEAWFVTTIISAVIVGASLVIYFKKIKPQH